MIKASLTSTKDAWQTNTNTFDTVVFNWTYHCLASIAFIFCDKKHKIRLRTLETVRIKECGRGGRGEGEGRERGGEGRDEEEEELKFLLLLFLM